MKTVIKLALSELRRQRREGGGAAYRVGNCTLFGCQGAVVLCESGHNYPHAVLTSLEGLREFAQRAAHVERLAIR